MREKRLGVVAARACVWSACASLGFVTALAPQARADAQAYAALAERAVLLPTSLATTADLSAPSMVQRPEVLRQRYVAIDSAALADAFVAAPRSTAPANTFRLDLFPDLQVDVAIARVEQPYAPGAGAEVNVLVGSVVGEPTSEVYLALGRDGVVVGDIYRHDLGTFQIRPLGDAAGTPGVHAVREIDESRLLPCGTSDRHAIRDPHQAGPNPEAPAGARGSVEQIDVLIVYTPSARNVAGGDNAIEAALANWVVQTNNAYSTSFVGQQLRLVRTQLTPHAELSTAEDDLAVLRGTSDGFMDEVHAVRDAYGADMVHLVSTSAGVCGIAYIQLSVGLDFQDRAFGLTVYSCGALTFAHELGHNMGCAHDRQNSSQGAYCYSFGFRTANNQFRTIMSYAPGTRIARFSTPLVTWSGFTMGVNGDGCPADGTDNSRTMNNTRSFVADFRPDAGPSDPPGAFDMTAPPNAAVAVSLTPTITWSTSQDAVNYDLVVSANEDLSEPAFSRRLGLTTVIIPSGHLAYGTVYYWSVVASNNLGAIGATSFMRTFRTRKLGDLNGDDIVSSTDLGVLLGSWGPCASCLADLDADGDVDSADLAALLGSWGA